MLILQAAAVPLLRRVFNAVGGVTGTLTLRFGSNVTFRVQWCLEISLLS